MMFLILRISYIENARGYFVFLGDDNSYGFDMPIELTKSPDGVIGARISSN